MVDTESNLRASVYITVAFLVVGARIRGSMQWTTILALCVRVLVALFTRTFFQPDEYLQSLEPAHVTVFGYGHLTWEWLAIRPIRGAVYPALNVPVYWALKATGLDRSWPSLLVCIHFLMRVTSYSYILLCQVAGPKILHGTLAAVTDVWVCELTTRVIGEKYVSTTVSSNIPTVYWHSILCDDQKLFLSLTSFFHALSLSRSLSNSLETSLTTIALAHYPWDLMLRPFSSSDL
jgi:phosphatidylinositol glycan class B